MAGPPPLAGHMGGMMGGMPVCHHDVSEGDLVLGGGEGGILPNYHQVETSSNGNTRKQPLEMFRTP